LSAATEEIKPRISWRGGAATKESEQEQTEKTEVEKLCRKCGVFVDSTTDCTDGKEKKKFGMQGLFIREIRTTV
jgi:hypothetical protein